MRKNLPPTTDHSPEPDHFFHILNMEFFSQEISKQQTLVNSLFQKVIASVFCFSPEIILIGKIFYSQLENYSLFLGAKVRYTGSTQEGEICMTVYLSENIRNHRKALGLTQEQLAEAMGVTVGAVSKWESGASTPEITLIMELAEFFETSVDVLLGFERQSGTLENMVKQLHQLRLQKEFETAFPISEKALQKFPNSFSVVYECATLYHLYGLEKTNNDALIRSQELFYRALELIDQNEDPDISPVSIRIVIAQGYLNRGETAKALELLKANNIEGINNGTIGTELAKDKTTCQEALLYLTKALILADNLLIEFCNGFVNACFHLNRFQEALDFTQLLLQFESGLQKPGKRSYHDKIHALLLYLCACASWRLGDPDGAKYHLRAAREKARFFDECPDYTANNLKYTTFDKPAAAYDNLGPTAWEGLTHLIEENRDEFPELLNLWEELNREQA